MSIAKTVFRKKLEGELSWRADLKSIVAAYDVGAGPDAKSAEAKYKSLVDYFHDKPCPTNLVGFVSAKATSAPAPAPAATPSAVIHDKLADFNSEKSVETNPVFRLRRHIKRLNANIDKLACEIADEHGSRREIAGKDQQGIHVQDPKWLPRPSIRTHESTAAFRNKPVRLCLEVVS